MVSPVLYMLIGPPCAGKSTWRAAYAPADAVIISSDDHIDAQAAAKGVTYSEAFRTIDMKAITRALNETYDHALRVGANIVIDRTNMTIKGRNKFLCRVPRNYERVGVIFGYDRTVLTERLIARAAATGKFVPETVVNDMIKSYQEPLASEFNRIIHV